MDSGKKKTQGIKFSMRIVIDARLWSETGPGRYIRNLIDQLQKIDKKNQYFVLLLKKDKMSVKFTENFTPVLANFRWYGFSEQLILPKLLGSLKPDLVHFPFFNVPYLYRGKFVVTIHDLIHQHFQMRRATTRDPLTYKIKKYGYKKVFFHAAKDSVKIIVPSNFIKDQVKKELNVDEDKIVVTYEAVEESFIKLAGQTKEIDFNKIACKFGLQKPYLFYVGNAHPHKNILGLIKAFLEFRKKYSQYSLVLSGPDNYFWKKVKEEAGAKGIVFTGFTSEQELATLYKNAVSYIFPSLEEGFGLPLLEAMAAGCPVISSSAASLSEVGGEAAIYFNPRDTDDMVKKMVKVVSDEKLRKELIIKGQNRYKEFSWQKMAEQTLGVYEEVI